MSFINCLLSLLFVMQYANTQTVSESEEINKLIDGLLSKTEKKNAEPIQFTWTDRFFEDPTTEFREFLDDKSSVEPENEHDTTYPTFMIMVKTTPMEGYSAKREIEIEVKDQESEVKSQDKEKEKVTKIRKANHSTKSKTRYKTRTTNKMFNNEWNTNDKMLSIIETTQKITIKPVDHEAFYVTKVPGGEIRERIFSGTIFDVSKSVTSTTKVISNFTNIKDTPTSSTTNTTPLSVSTPEVTITPADHNSKDHSDIDEEYEKTIMDINKIHKDDGADINAKKLSVIKALEDLINSIPNYKNQVEKEKYEEIMKGMLPVSKVVEGPSKTRVINPKQSIGTRLFQILGNHKNNIMSPEDLFKNIMMTIISSTAMPIETHGLDFRNDQRSADIDNYWNSDTTTDPNVISSPTSTYTLMKKPQNSTDTSTDLYILADEKKKDLKGYFKLTEKSTTTPQKGAKVNKLKKLIAPFHYKAHDKDKHKSHHNNVNDGLAYKDLLQLINTLEKKKPKQNTEYTNWEKIKKFLGHDRVCDCKCKANQTICKVCAATDRVMRELTFEFNNLSKFMSDHCMEIQTYFWMNPSGGKKLRDSVHNIDKSLHDYYKRVRGKCTGRTCKTFASYLDKRHLELLKKAKVKYPWISTNIT